MSEENNNNPQDEEKMEWDYPEQNPNYKGNPLDPILKNGPVDERNCTDCFWCILYLLSIGMFVGIAIYAFSNGDPAKTFAPYNYDNQQCGVSPGYQNCKYGFIDFHNDNNTYCVSSCPTGSGQTVSCENVQYAAVTYDSKPFQDICQPTSETQEMADYASMSKTPGLENAFAQVDSVWPVTLGVCFIAFFVAIIISGLIKECAGVFIWVSYTLFLLIMIGLGFALWAYAQDYPVFRGWLLGFAYTSWACAGIGILLLPYLCKKIRLAVAVLRASIDFIKDVPGIMIVPFFLFGVKVVYFMVWMFSSLFLIACGTSKPVDGSPFPEIELDGSIITLLVANLFSFYWNCFFALSFMQYVVGSSCALWYYRGMGKDIGHAVALSIKNALGHHSGSIALGGFILTVIKFIQLIFSAFYSCVKDATISNKKADGCTKICCCCCSYLISYFEGYIRFIDQNAYIMMALKGEVFCKSAHDAYYLLKRNSMLSDITDGIGEMFAILANLFIGLGAAMCGYGMIISITQYQSVSPILPTLFFIIIALMIASFFMKVYGVSIDTILMCYLVDEESCKDEGGAKHAPPSLIEFLDKYYPKRNADIQKLI